MNNLISHADDLSRKRDGYCRVDFKKVIGSFAYDLEFAFNGAPYRSIIFVFLKITFAAQMFVNSLNRNQNVGEKFFFLYSHNTAIFSILIC